MLQSLKSLFGQYLVLLLLLLVLTLTASCSKGPLSLLTGGGPNVAANTQLGKTNTQTVGTTKVTDQRISNSTAESIKQSTDTNEVKADKVDSVVVNNVNIPTWMIIALVLWSLLLWELPAPRDIAKGIKNMFKFRK